MADIKTAGDMKVKINRRVAFIGLVVSANLLLSAHAIYSNFATPEEVREISAGLSHWGLGSFLLGRDTPPLARLVAVLPVMVADHSEWFLGYVDLPLYMGTLIQDQIGGFFASENARQFVDLVRLARLAGVGWWLVGAWVMFRWCHALYGRAVAYLGLALWSVEPYVLACEPLATPDLPVAVSVLAASYAFWRYLQKETWERAAVAGLLLGVAELADFAALLLYPPWLGLAVVFYLGRGRPMGGAVVVGRRVVHAALMVYLSTMVINCGYAATDSCQALKTFDFVSQLFGGGARVEDPLRGNFLVGNRFRGSWLGELPAFFPADYLLGVDSRALLTESDGPSSRVQEKVTLDGTESPGVVTLTARVPPALWLMLGWSATLVLFRRSERAAPSDGLFWILPVLAFGVIAASPAGYRFLNGHILMPVPFMVVGASKLAVYFQPGHWKAGAWAVVLAVGTTTSSLSSLFPYSRQPFGESPGSTGKNRPTGMPVRHESGSQDLLRLREWQRGHPEARPFGVAVRHIVDPREFGIDCSLPAPDSASPLRFRNFAPPGVGPLPGYYALDRYHLAGGNYAYFRYFAPIASVGCSIFVFHIQPEAADGLRKQLGLSSLADAERPNRGTNSVFQVRVYEDRRGKKSRYAVFVPEKSRNEPRRPLILFLHGAGDAGTDGRQFLNVGLPRIIEQGLAPGFIVVCPQGPTGHWSARSEESQRALEILGAVEKELNVDPKRIILTGVSSGGSGTWGLAARYPERWAAIVPISSTCDKAEAGLIRHIPCWCFHNCNDQEGHYHRYTGGGAPVELPRGMIRALVAAGGRPRYSELLHVGDTHNAWDYAYTLPELWEWMSRQRRP
jgi:poly(3-hydroxybutyrate) depolymerase